MGTTFRIYRRRFIDAGQRTIIENKHTPLDLLNKGSRSHWQDHSHWQDQLVWVPIQKRRQRD